MRVPSDCATSHFYKPKDCSAFTGLQYRPDIPTFEGLSTREPPELYSTTNGRKVGQATATNWSTSGVVYRLLRLSIGAQRRGVAVTELRAPLLKPRTAFSQILQRKGFVRCTARTTVMPEYRQ